MANVSLFSLGVIHSSQDKDKGIQFMVVGCFAPLHDQEAEAKTREEVEALEKRLREAERSAVEATSRGAERAKQARVG